MHNMLFALVILFSTSFTYAETNQAYDNPLTTGFDHCEEVSEVMPYRHVQDNHYACFDGRKLEFTDYRRFLRDSFRNADFSNRLFFVNMDQTERVNV